MTKIHQYRDRPYLIIFHLQMENKPKLFTLAAVG